MTYSKRFDAAVDFVFKHECVYNSRGNVIVEDVPGDSGGLTKYGIDAASHPNVDIANLTRDGAIEIYYKCYWCPAHAEELNPPIGEFMFDTAVNNGLVYAVQVLQRALGVDTDGVIGPVTLQAANRSNPQELFTRLINARDEHYHSIVNRHPTNAKFLKGWLNRTKDLLAFGDTVGERREEAIA
jgi:lysozyme family protein